MLRGIIIIIFFVSEPILFLPLSLLQKRGEREEGTAEKLPGVGKGERRNMCCWVMWLYHVTGESGPAAAAAAARPRRRQTLDAGLVGRSDGRQAGRQAGLAEATPDDFCRWLCLPELLPSPGEEVREGLGLHHTPPQPS